MPVINTLTAGIQRLTSWFQNLTGDGQHIAMVFGGVAAIFGALYPVLARLSGFMSPMVLAMGTLTEGILEFLEGTAEGKMILRGLGEAWDWLAAKIGTLKEIFSTAVNGVVVACQGIVRAFTWVAIKMASLIEAILDWLPGLGGAVESIRTWRGNAEQNLAKMMDSGWGLQQGKKIEFPKNNVTLANGQFEGLGAAWQRVTESANKLTGGPEDTRHEAAMAKQNELIDAVRDVREAVKNQNPMLAR